MKTDYLRKSDTIFASFWDASISFVGLYWGHDARVWPCEETMWWAEGFHESTQFLINRRFQRVATLFEKWKLIFMNGNSKQNEIISAMYMDICSLSSFLVFVWSPRASLPYFTTHMDLVQRQQEAIRQRKAIKKGLQSDKDWTGDGFVKETESMVSNWIVVNWPKHLLVWLKNKLCGPLMWSLDNWAYFSSDLRKELPCINSWVAYKSFSCINSWVTYKCFSQLCFHNLQPWQDRR